VDGGVARRRDSLAVFGFNMLGDALRDVHDPRLRGS
jgi:ABC-type dipeptide/oligopeptide/nickel transport system permease subunit